MKSELVKRGRYYDGYGMHEEAYTYYLEAALYDEDPEAIFELGVKYLCGSYVDRDYEKAFKYFKTAYDKNNSLESLYYITQEYDELAKDKTGRRLVKEFMDYMLECGQWEMYISIGDEYGTGRIYPLDVSKQIECYEKAIEKGINVGCDCLAELYFEGKVVEQDCDKAYQYLMSYDGYGSFSKPFYLAEMYRKGICVKKDTGKAKELYRSIVDDDVAMKFEDRYYLRACEILEEMNLMKE